MKRVRHLIPYDAIGGVEVAARSIPLGIHKTRNEELRLERQYLVNSSGASSGPTQYHGPSISLNNPYAYWHAFVRLLQDPPDLLIASLWRCALVLIVYKMMRPNRKAVLFLHLAHNVHWLDRIANYVAMRLADSIWADSFTTLKHRVPPDLQHKGRVISFLLENRSQPEITAPSPDFIFWGRLSPQKGLDRALKIFSSIVVRLPAAHFTIIGPDGGIKNELMAQARQLGIENNVSFTGAKAQADIRTLASSASFYLQTSIDEGMALSVVEAMQTGLVPIVTPVGEISRYCAHGKNAVFVLEDAPTVDAVMSLLADPVRYKRMSYAVGQYWEAKPLYRDDFLGAAKELLG